MQRETTYSEGLLAQSHPLSTVGQVEEGTSWWAKPVHRAAEGPLGNQGERQQPAKGGLVYQSKQLGQGWTPGKAQSPFSEVGAAGPTPILDIPV